MIKNKKIRLCTNFALIVFIVSLVFNIFDTSYARYNTNLINDGDVSLAPWNIAINKQKVTSAGVSDVLVDLVVTKTTSKTETYQNKIVPGCQGYFDLEINPAGTGVSVDYDIDLNPDELPGGMVYTGYEILKEDKTVIKSFPSIPSDSKITGNISLVDRQLLTSDDTLRYRIYWNYVDDDELNEIFTNVDKQNSMLINITLNQST